jgi:peroxiredoxin
MGLTASNIDLLGSKAFDFRLLEVKSEKEYSLDDLKGPKGTLVMFICNHCPYVIHIIDGIVALANEYQKEGISFIAINSNDVISYPEDGPENMVRFAKEHHFPFHYLFDESQHVAKQYDAVCTPDFNLLDENKVIIYRGRFDIARPGNKAEINGSDMREAIDRLLKGEDPVKDQFPSLGCNIKWK